MENVDIINSVKRLKNNVAELVSFLEKLGKLPVDLDTTFLIDLTKHSNEKVRMWAVKTIGKLKSLDYLDLLTDLYHNENSTIVRREIVSSIGRMRDFSTKDVLFDILSDNDPKIVCQAIRGLLVFKGDPQIDSALQNMQNHENEMVKSAIKKAYFSKSNNKQVLSHTEIYPFLKNVVVNGDVIDVLKYVPEDSVHLTFTSPPYYNARDYSIYTSYEAYLNFLEEVFRETMRITKEGRFLIVNTSPVIEPRISRAHSSKRYPIPFDLHNRLTNIGWEFIDDIIWMKPEYSVKNRIGGFQQHRKPLGYKPNNITEYLMVYRKPTDKLLDWNMRQYDDDIVQMSKVADGFETTNVWQISPKSDKVHSAIFPPELCKRVVLYYSYIGDLIFDPFGGSGTLGRTAFSLKRSFFLTEKEPEYFEYIKQQNDNDSLFKEEARRFLSLDEFIKTVQI